MNRFYWAILMLFLINISFAQDKKAVRFAKTITTVELEARLGVLASDSLEGRETGEKGQKIAMNYIASHFEKIGLEPPVDGSYIQSFPLQKAVWNEIYLKKGDELKENLVDFLYYSSYETKGEEYIDLIFLTDSADFDQHEVEGKFLVMKNDSWGGWDTRIKSLNDYSPAGYLIISAEESELDFAMSRFSRFYTQPRVSKSFDESGDRIVIVKEGVVQWAYGKPMGELKEGETARLILNADRLIEDISGENVLGFLEGSKKPDEILVVTSHYDHIGINPDGEINNGADDDGSGTTAVLEIAEAFATAADKGNRPERSILFMCVSGEEKGLLGSQYYTDESPVFPLENTIVNLNMDMIGRVDDRHEGNPNYIYVIGADKLSSELNTLHERINEVTVNLEFDYTYNDENDPNRFYYRSDHYNFAKNNIPIIFYFNGTHPDYHKPTDTIDKINFDRIKKVADLVFHTAWEIANREDRLKVD